MSFGAANKGIDRVTESGGEGEQIPHGILKSQQIMSALPADYLRWIVQNFEPGDILEEAKRILASPALQGEADSKTLEQKADEILGEKPVGLLRRGFRRRKR